MGSKYHMYHHTAYRDNYGQFFVFFDWLHGTLTDPLLLQDPAQFGKADKSAATSAEDGSMFAGEGGGGSGGGGGVANAPSSGAAAAAPPSGKNKGAKQR